MKTPRRPQNPIRSICLLFTFCAGLAGCGSGIRQSGNSATIFSLPTEDVVPSCTYDVTLEPMGQTQQGVIVLFERADTDLLYNDQAFRDKALALHYAILWAHECYAASSNDLQADAAKGPARMLFAALSQLAKQTEHPELATAGIIMYGFSAAGVLTATIANDYPDRLQGVIQYASASGSTDLDGVRVKAAAKIPALILANADDAVAGTSRSLRYFNQGRTLGAPWAFGVENATQHCCNVSTQNIILPWMQTIAQANAAGTSSSSGQGFGVGVTSHFVCTPDGVSDTLGEIDCKITAASLGDSSATVSQPSGWLPDQDSAAAWLAWVTNPQTN